MSSDIADSVLEFETSCEEDSIICTAVPRPFLIGACAMPTTSSPMLCIMHKYMHHVRLIRTQTALSRLCDLFECTAHKLHGPQHSWFSFNEYTMQFSILCLFTFILPSTYAGTNKTLAPTPGMRRPTPFPTEIIDSPAPTYVLSTPEPT